MYQRETERVEVRKVRAIERKLGSCNEVEEVAESVGAVRVWGVNVRELSNCRHPWLWSDSLEGSHCRLGRCHQHDRPQRLPDRHRRGRKP